MDWIITSYLDIWHDKIKASRANGQMCSICQLRKKDEAKVEWNLKFSFICQNKTRSVNCKSQKALQVRSWNVLGWVPMCIESKNIW